MTNLVIIFCRVSFIVKYNCTSSDNSVVRTVSKRGVLFQHTLSPIGANAISCCNYLDVFLSHISRINKQFVWHVYHQRVLIPECNKVDVIKELLNVKYNFATVHVLDWADIVFSTESLCTE